jgi:hypothetical protein
MTRAAVWTLITAAVVLATRTIVYAVAPSQSQLLVALAHQTGPPDAVGALIVLATVAAMAGVAALWLAVIAVRERIALEQREIIGAPRLRPSWLAARAVGVFATASLVFAMLESYIHWRAGLGWHGLHCLVGPVHRDAIPVLAGLSILAVAAHGAVEHLLAWARRLVALLTARLPLLRGAATVHNSTVRLRSSRIWSVAVPRGPPFGAFA